MSQTEVQVAVSEEVSLHTIVSISPKANARSLIVFLHFWGGSNKTYASVISHLKDDYNIIAPSLRGWGKSSKPASIESYSVKHYAADVYGLLQYFQKNQPELFTQGIVYVGHSMGGKIAQYLVTLSSAAIRVKGLVLLASAPISPLVLPEELREQQKHAYDNEQTATFVFSNLLLAGPETVSGKVMEELVADATGASNEAKQAWASRGLGEDYEKLVIDYLKKEVLEERGPKVLVLVGEQDRIETPENMDLRIAQPLSKAGVDVKVERLSGVAHMIPVEAADLAASLINTFVSGL